MNNFVLLKGERKAITETKGHFFKGNSEAVRETLKDIDTGNQGELRTKRQKQTYEAQRKNIKTNAVSSLFIALILCTTFSRCTIFRFPKASKHGKFKFLLPIKTDQYSSK